MRPPLTLQAFVVASLSGLLPAADDSPLGLSQEVDAACKWFDTLGFPDLKGRPLVRVATGSWLRSGNERARNSYLRAFLLEDGKESFRVLTEDLKVRVFEKTGLGAEPHEVVSHEALDLAAEAKAFAERLRSSPDDELDRNGWQGPPLELPAKAFLFAHACARNGLAAQANALYEVAESLLEEQDDGELRSLGKAFGVQIGHVVFWRAILAFEDPSQTRKDLLDILHPFAERYPESEHAETARDLVTVLERMVREDDERLEEQPGREPSKEEKVERLVYQLRDQGCQVSTIPGRCNIFSGWRRSFEAEGELPNPAAELAALGFEAFPRLMAALDDDRLTRAVDSGRGNVFGHRVMTVGDCAHEILEHIAGSQFYRRFQDDPEAWDLDYAAYKKAVARYWTAFQEKGEKQMLIEGTALGDSVSRSQALRLVERYPDEATGAIRRGMEAAKDDGTRGDLLEALGRLQTNAAVTALREELASGKTLRARLGAAEALFEKGDSTASVAAMARDWERLGREGGFVTRDTDVNGESAQKHLIRFLARSDSPAAVRALGHDAGSMPLDFRRELIDALRYAATGFLSAPAPEARTAIEEVLVSLLDDETETGAIGGGSVHPRIRDLAAAALAENWGEKYRFQPAESPRARDRAIAEVGNAWLGSQGREPLPLPRGSRALEDPAAVVSLLCASVGEAAEEAAVKEMMAGLAVRGPQALPTMWKRLETSPADLPGKGALQEVHARFERMVIEAEFYPALLSASEETSKALAALVGNPLLTPEPLLRVLAAFASGLPGEAQGLEVLVNRAEGGAPLSVTARCVAERAGNRPRSSRGLWHAELYYSAGGRAGSGQEDSLDAERARSTASYLNLERGIEKTLRASTGGKLALKLTLLRPQGQ